VTISNALLSQLYAQESNDPFLVLLTLTHVSFGTLRFVANTVDITSRGNTFEAFPFKITLPADDGESLKDIVLTLDNVSLQLITSLRSITNYIAVKIELVLASNPDLVEIEIDGLKINSVSYNAESISANLILDNFLNTELTSEKYTASLYRGLFT